MTLIRRALTLAIAVSSSIAQAQQSAWDELERIPSEIDLAIVMDDASAVLLKDEVAMSRGVLSAIGIMPNTRRAWRSLSNSLGMTSDEAIRTLLSGRVTLLLDWDKNTIADTDPRLPEMLAHIDTHWVLGAQIPASTLDSITNKLKPVPRDIVDGVLIYAIEQGRFSLAIVAPDEHQPNAQLLLSPKGASRTLELALANSRAEEHTDLPCAPIADTDDEAPCIAVRTRPDVFSSENAAVRFAGDGYIWVKLSESAPDHGRAEIALTPTREQLNELTAGAVGGERGASGAPIHLLGSASPDSTLLACATSPVMRLDLSNGLGIDVSLDPPAGSAPFDPRGSFLLITDPEDPSAPESTQVSTLLSRCAPGSVDIRALDHAIARAIGSDAHDFGGSFPGATRTQPYRTEQDIPAAVSWKVLDHGASSDVIVSFAPTEASASAAVTSLSERIALIESISPEPLSSTTIAKGTLDLARVFDLVTGPGNTITPFPQDDIRGTLDWSIVIDDGVLRAVIETTPDHGASFPERKPSLGAD